MADAVCLGVWFVDEPDQGAVHEHTETSTNDNAEEDCAHDANGEAVRSEIDEWERLEERVLQETVSCVR